MEESEGLGVCKNSKKNTETYEVAVMTVVTVRLVFCL